MPIVSDKYRATPEYDEVREILIDAARRGTVVQYHPAITQVLGLTEPSPHMAGELGQILGEISEDEHLAGRPMLSALAIGTANRPGKGFFDLARALGKCERTDEDGFWMMEMRAACEYWQRR